MFGYRTKKGTNELDLYMSRKHDELLATTLEPGSYKKTSSLVIVDGFSVEITEDQVNFLFFIFFFQILLCCTISSTYFNLLFWFLYMIIFLVQKLIVVFLFVLIRPMCLDLQKELEWWRKIKSLLSLYKTREKSTWS